MLAVVSPLPPVILEVRADPKQPDRGWLTTAERVYPCRLGRAGVSSTKREGDGATPAGRYPLRRVLFRSDRLAVETQLSTIAIGANDGWCDDPARPEYNRPVTLPFSGSAEALWRDDHAYDVVVVLGHNDDPPIAGHGSAIFLHVAHDDGRPTAGCIALSARDLLHLLARITAETTIVIQPA